MQLSPSVLSVLWFSIVGKYASSRQGKRPKVKRSYWSFEERQFYRELKGTSVKGIEKDRCELAIENSGGILDSRTWIMVKSCLRNQTEKNKQRWFAEKDLSGLENGTHPLVFTGASGKKKIMMQGKWLF